MNRHSARARLRIPVALGALFAGLLGSADTAVAQDVADVARRAQSAYFGNNAMELGRVASGVSAWATSADSRERYAYAYVQFRALQVAMAAGPRDNDAKAAAAACTKSLDAVVAKEPKFADAWALQSACWGYLANLGGFAAIGNGRRSGKSMEAALAAGSATPRVLLVDAFGLYFRPKIAGGDKAKGCARFKEAAAAFESARSPAPAAWIDWGAAEAQFWNGRCAAEAGDAAGARRAYERALQLAPEFLAARKRLAP
jgi:tetratricopeptide (TPR) repeat protein